MPSSCVGLRDKSGGSRVVSNSSARLGDLWQKILVKEEQLYSTRARYTPPTTCYLVLYFMSVVPLACILTWLCSIEGTGNIRPPNTDIAALEKPGGRRGEKEKGGVSVRERGVSLQRLNSAAAARVIRNGRCMYASCDDTRDITSQVLVPRL